MAISEVISVEVAGLGQLDALAAGADKASEAMAKLKAAASGGASGAGADKMAASMDAAAGTINAAVAKIEASFERLAGVGDSAAAGIERMDSAAAAAEGSLGDVAAGADAAAASSDRLAESADAAGAALDRQAVAGTRAGAAGAEAGAAGAAGGSKLKEMALGAAVTLGYAVDQSMKFNSQMTTLNTQAGVSKNQLGTLSKGVLDLAGQVGQSPGNLAESLYHVESNMASLGIKAPQALNMVKVAAEGASVGHANLVDVTNALTASVASGIPGVQNYSQAMGVLNATVGAGDMNMQDLADAMGTGAVAAVKGYGLNIKDVGAALATFGDNNIRGAKAGTDLRMSVQSLAVPVATAGGELKKLGLTQTTLATDMQSGGLLKALDDLQSKFKAGGVTAANEGQVITELFGKKAGVGLSILMGQMDRFQSKYPDLTKGANDFGQAWNATLETPQQKLKNLEAGAQALAITFGNIAMPAASGIVGGLDKAMSWVQGHSAASTGLTVGLGALVTGALTKGLFSGVETGLSGLGNLGSLLHIPGASTLANAGTRASTVAGSAGASTGLDAVATAADGAAAALSRIADEGIIPGKPGVPGEGEPTPVVAGGGKPKIPGAAADEEEAVTGLKKYLPDVAGLGAAVSPVVAGIAAAAVIRGIGDSMAPAGTPAGNVNRTLQNPQKNPFDQANPGVNAVIGGYGANIVSSGAGQSIGGWTNDVLKNLFGGGNVHRPAGQPATYMAGAGPFGAYPISGANQNIPVPDTWTPQAPGVSHWTSITGGMGGQAGAPKPPPASSDALLGVGGHPGTVARIPAPDVSALDAAKTKVQAAMTAIDTAISKANAHPGALTAPDMSALETAKSKVQTEMDQIGQALSKAYAHPASIPAPDLSNLTSGAAKADAAAQQILQNVNKALSKPAIAAAPNLSAYSAAVGTALTDGQAISAGLATGIIAGEGQVVQAAQQVAAAATAAMANVTQTHSPSKVTQKTGSDVSAGLAAGITSGTTAVKNASTNIGSSSITSIIQGLQGGQSNLQNAQQAIAGSLSNPDAVTQIQQTILGLQQAIPASNKALLGQLAQYQTQLTGLANKQGALEAQINNAQQVATAQIGNASILNSAQYQPALQASNGGSGGPQSAITTITGLGYQAKDQTAYAQQLQQLQKMGLNATTESQLAQAGASAGLPIAQGLTQGGKAAVAQVNQLEGQIVGASKQIGSVAGPAMYQAGVQAGQGLAAGLKSALGGVDAAMTKMAAEIVAIVKKDLKISSPSQLMADEVGAMIPAGVGIGIDRGTPAATAAMSRMGARLSTSPLAGFSGAPGGSGGGGGDTHYHVTNNVTVQGSVMSEQSLFAAVQQATLRAGSNNWTTGLIFPGRHT